MSIGSRNHDTTVDGQVLDEAPEYFEKMSEIEARRTGSNPGIGISGVKMMP
ncbi:hypothetical protein ACW7G2_01955 [Luteimonas sp. A277]